jgi:putative transposase
MPKYARKNLLADSLLYHVYNRSNAKATIFRCDQDYQHFKRILLHYVMEFSLKIYHWVIMPTHYHLLLEIAEPVLLSKALGGIALAYTQYYHKKYNSCGYLWQGRFQSRPIQRQPYLFFCGRYIERNPVKAGIVEFAQQYPYSSAPYYCLGMDDGITSEDEAYANLAANPVERRQQYSALLHNANIDDDADWENMESPRGDREFIERFVKYNGRLVPHKTRRGKLAL